MIDRRAELGLWIPRLETILISRGVLSDDGELVAQVGSRFPKDVEDALDGFIENPIELMGLLKICRDACDGRPLSPAVLMAAHLMTREVLQALEAAGAIDFKH
ncbi:hypothetical protein N2600_26260 (plasmid) [Rhizobium sp. WSM1274]|uniref:hypothetical protein n=1 Tax=Rhizobium sp. WSM1274 TaxID=3138254 RepID=UPI0021A2E23C|nr:hypothetical protein [Rhizobium leguminosarum]UWU31695.1 hypothetical protein N2600_26260 [Rhizobium leguminosarum bv. viciae]